MRQLKKIKQWANISPTGKWNNKLTYGSAGGSNYKSTIPSGLGQKLPFRAPKSAHISGRLGIPVYIRKGRAAPKWQNLNESQKQYKSLQIIKSLYGNISQNKLIITRNKSKGFANVISKLETRLDILVYRLQFADSIGEARDLIKKGFICINSKPITFSGFFVNNGSSISSTHVNSAYNRISYRQLSISMPYYLYHTSYLSGILLYNPYTITPLTEAPLFPHFKYFNASFPSRSRSLALY